jgi:hypothetical protein
VQRLLALGAIPSVAFVQSSRTIVKSSIPKDVLARESLLLDILTLLTLIGLPKFVNVIVLGPLIVPTGCSPKSRGLGSIVGVMMI